MDIVHRIWPRETVPSDLQLSLAERLRQLSSDEAGPKAAGDETGKQSQAERKDGSASGAKEEPPKAGAGAEAAAESASAEATPPVEGANGGGNGQSGEAVEAHAADREEGSRGKSLETPAGEEGALVGAERPTAVKTSAEAQDKPQFTVTFEANSPDEASTAREMPKRGFFRAPIRGGKPPAGGNGNGAQVAKPPADGRQKRSTPEPSSEDFNRQFLEQFQAAVERAETTGTNTLASVQQALSELQSSKAEFESELRARLDGALAEMERRQPSQQTSVDSAITQIEQRAREAGDNVLREVQGQAWVMLNAVASELRAFRDQFGKEIQERAGLLDRATQQALRLKEKIEQALPQAENALRTLSVASQEATGGIQTASAAAEEQLRRSREALSQEIEGQKSALKALADECGEDARRLKEETEKFQKEAGAACDVLGHMADQSLERLKAGADEADGRIRTGLESLSAAAEERLGQYREALSQEIEAQRGSVNSLRDECNQDAQRLKEETEKFQREAGAACDVLARLADQSLERLNAGADEAGARIRTGLENLAAEIERYILSGGLVEKASGQIEKAAQEVVEPAIERLKNAGGEADSSVDSLNKAGQLVASRLDAAKQEIGARLDNLMNEQQSALEAAMGGFQRKATAELGSLVERVVEQSSQQLDERLHAVFQDLMLSTAKQINSSTRSTLGTLHLGLKQVFEPPADAPEASEAGSETPAPEQ